MEGYGVGEDEGIYAGIVVVDAGVGDVADGDAEARAVVEAVGDFEGRAELEDMAEVLAVAFGVAPDREGWG